MIMVSETGRHVKRIGTLIVIIITLLRRLMWQSFYLVDTVPIGQQGDSSRSIYFYRSFHQVIVPCDLLPSLLPFLKGITLFLPNRPGTPAQTFHESGLL